MNKRYCDVCADEIGSMRAYHQIITLYPRVLKKDPIIAYQDCCHKCYKKFHTRLKEGEE